MFHVEEHHHFLNARENLGIEIAAHSKGRPVQRGRHNLGQRWLLCQSVQPLSYRDTHLSCSHHICLGSFIQEWHDDRAKPIFHQTRTGFTQHHHMSGKRPASGERQPDEQGSAEEVHAQDLRASPLHLSASQQPPVISSIPPRGSPHVTGRAGRTQHVSPPSGYPHHHSRRGGGQQQPPPPQHAQQYAGAPIGRQAPTVTPDSRGMLPHQMPSSSGRRRPGGAISAMSASPSARGRIGECRFFELLSIFLLKLKFPLCPG